MRKLKIFISSVQNEFAEERVELSSYFRNDPLLGSFFESLIFEEIERFGTGMYNLIKARELKPPLVSLEEGIKLTINRGGH